MAGESTQDILDLCEEQGYRYDYLRGGNGVRVFPKQQGLQTVTLRWTTPGDKHAEMNNRAALRRIGLKFPIDIEREKTKEKPMIEAPRPPSAQTARAVTTAAAGVPPNAIAVARAKLSLAIDALGDLEQALAQIEAEHKDVENLKSMLRKMAL